MNSNGNMNKVMNEVMLAEDGTREHPSTIHCDYELNKIFTLRLLVYLCPDDFDRFLAMVEKASNDGEIKIKVHHTKRKRKTAASQRKAKKEAAAAEKLSAALKARAQHRTIVKNNRENDFNAILSKYSQGKHQHCDPPPINDAEFEAARSRLEHNRCKAKAGPK